MSFRMNTFFIFIGIALFAVFLYFGYRDDFRRDKVGFLNIIYTFSLAIICFALMLWAKPHYDKYIDAHCIGTTKIEGSFEEMSKASPEIYNQWLQKVMEENVAIKEQKEGFSVLYTCICIGFFYFSLFVFKRFVIKKTPPSV